MGMGSGKGKAPKSVAKEKAAVKAKDKAVGKAETKAAARGMNADKAKGIAERMTSTKKPAGKIAGQLLGGDSRKNAYDLKKAMRKANADKKPAGQMSKGLSDLMSGTKAPGMKKGGCAKMAKGGGCEVRGKTKGKFI